MSKQLLLNPIPTPKWIMKRIEKKSSKFLLSESKRIKSYFKKVLKELVKTVKLKEKEKLKLMLSIEKKKLKEMKLKNIIEKKRLKMTPEELKVRRAELQRVYKDRRKHCDICNVSIIRTNFPTHKKSKKHIRLSSMKP